MRQPIFTRDQTEAQARLAHEVANIGRTESMGRITETLMGATLVQMERGGRPLYRIDREVFNHDPLVDAGLPAHVRAARAAFSKRGA